MESLTTYLPIDRCHAIIQGIELPDSTRGAALFADISGFTPLTESLLQAFGPRRGAEALTTQLTQVYNALLPEIHAYRGSVISFGGDAVICWFDGDNGLRATTCALALQQAITRFSAIMMPSGISLALRMKVAIASGSARRFLVGDPAIQVMDVIAGTTIDQVSVAEGMARQGEVVLAGSTVDELAGQIAIAEWRRDSTTGQRFAVVAYVATPPDADPWPDLEQYPTASRLHVRPWILPPVYERLNAGQSQFLAEIRPAVAIFMRFGGIDYNHDPQAGAHLDAYIRWVQNQLARYEGFLLQVIMGDKGSYLYAAFGAPIAHDDDPTRAVAVSLDLLTPPAHLSNISNIQIGVTRGIMHAGAYGSTMRHTYGVLGDEVNLAARLMARAEPGQILVSGRIAYNVRDNYDLMPMGLVQVKGKQEPVPVSLVRGRRLSAPSRSSSTTTEGPVGRAQELVECHQALNLATTGSGQILRLEGVAGIGKSQLSAAFSKQAVHQGAHVVRGACQSTSQNIAYIPWRQVFWSLFGLSDAEDELSAAYNQVDDDLENYDTTTLTFFASKIERLTEQVRHLNPNWLLRLPLLGDLLGLPIPDNSTTAAFEPRLRQEALFALIIDLLHIWSRQQPILLLMEDVHWMDEASLNMTLAISRVIASMPILLMLVQRPSPRDNQPLLPELYEMPTHQQITLGELALEDVSKLVSNRLNAPVSPLALALIQYQAQGNPFFTEELLDALRETGKLQRQDDGTWTLADSVIDALRAAQCLTRNAAGERVLVPNPPLSAAELGIPDSIHGIVLSRLDRLPEDHKLTLKVASVIGRIFDLDILAQVHPGKPDLAELKKQIQMAESRDFTRMEVPSPRLTYIFRHNVTQEVAYDTLLESQRRDLHFAVGATLERLQPEEVEQIAYHYSRSHSRDKALLYLDRAAHKTQREYANETALAYYTQALALEENWTWRRGEVEILHTLGRREEQHTALSKLENAPGAPISVVAHLWGEYFETTGEYERAQQAVERALSDARARSDILDEARSLAQLGLINHRQGDYEHSREWYEQALVPFPDHAARSDEEIRILITSLNGLGRIHLQQATFERAQGYFEQALHLSRASRHHKGEADSLNNLGMVAQYQRRTSDALAFYRQALELQRAIGDRAGEGGSLGNMAQVIQAAGDYGQAREYFAASLQTHQAIGHRWNEITDWNDLGILYQELGDLAQAQQCLQQGLRLSRIIGDEAGEAYILSNLGLVARDQNDLATAEQILSESLRLAEAQDDTYLAIGSLSYLGDISLLRQDAAQAIERAISALTLKRELELHLETTYDLATLAAASLAQGEQQQALIYARQAVTILDECGGEGPESPQRDYFLCAQVLAALNEPDAARTALQAAYQLITRRAQKITDPTLRRSFLERVSINRQIIQAASQQ